MEKKDLSMVDRFKQEVAEYCNMNKIDNIDEFVYNCFKQGFDIKKYGISPFKKEEVKMEQPKVEETKQIEEVSYNSKMKMLQETLAKLRKELFEKNNKIAELELALENCNK
jgi:predicted RNase H-like nuclease (RuvC/YqgF family)